MCTRSKHPLCVLVLNTHYVYSIIKPSTSTFFFFCYLFLSNSFPPLNNILLFFSHTSPSTLRALLSSTRTLGSGRYVPRQYLQCMRCQLHGGMCFLSDVQCEGFLGERSLYDRQGVHCILDRFRVLQSGVREKSQCYCLESGPTILD